MPVWLGQLIKWVGLPLLKELGAFILNWAREQNERRKQNSEINKEIKKLKQSKSKKDIIDHLRKLGL